MVPSFLIISLKLIIYREKLETFIVKFKALNNKKCKYMNNTFVRFLTYLDLNIYDILI